LAQALRSSRIGTRGEPLRPGLLARGTRGGQGPPGAKSLWKPGPEGLTIPYFVQTRRNSRNRRYHQSRDRLQLTGQRPSHRLSLQKRSQARREPGFVQEFLARDGMRVHALQYGRRLMGRDQAVDAHLRCAPESGTKWRWPSVSPPAFALLLAMTGAGDHRAVAFLGAAWRIRMPPAAVTDYRLAERR